MHNDAALLCTLQLLKKEKWHDRILRVMVIFEYCTKSLLMRTVSAPHTLCSHRPRISLEESYIITWNPVQKLV
jgi:hypothetical protein